MDYKLIALDLDGTLTNSRKEISPRNREALIRVQQQGVLLTLASGRPTYGIAPLADELRMQDFGGFVLAYNGGEVICWETKEMVYAKVLPEEAMPVIYDCVRSCGQTLLTYSGAEVLTEHASNPYVQQAARRNRMAVRETNDFLTEVVAPVPKCLAVGNPEELTPLEAVLRVRLSGQVNVFRSEPYFLEIVPAGIDKAAGLDIILGLKGIRREETVAIGDGFNDVPLMQLAGVGVAMGNAQEPVKRAADWVAPSNDDDGVAAAIARFFPPQ